MRHIFNRLFTHLVEHHPRTHECTYRRHHDASSILRPRTTSLASEKPPEMPLLQHAVKMSALVQHNESFNTTEKQVQPTRRCQEGQQRLEKIGIPLHRPPLRGGDWHEQATGRSRTKTIHGFVKRAGEYTFDKDGQDIQVQHYFSEAYGIKMRHPTIFGVKLSKNPKKLDVVPLQFCTIKPGQLYKKKLPEVYTSDMVRFATMKPYQRHKG